ncbi:cytochrome P450 [Mycobacterium sp. DBP42]|jgi:cytochrome P450|uniref:cytochrome P450 n=1 Tax=Mycobacterium sp. DBP42 TaxID=2545267 RepID=UPI00110CEDF0|nr:cytochrome P450 [Mycobacterium sp. DBP42]TMS52452.1 cytochrome P450 [Mycobacterium sp. DBP42]
MSIDADSVPAGGPPNVFDASLPDLDYYQLSTFEEVHRRIAQAREVAPIALGPLGPECLTYELVRAVLRDVRFIAVPGFGIGLQGVSSGPLWDRVTKVITCMEGEDHRRLRQLVSKGFAPRSVARLESFIAGLISELVAPHVAAGQCDVVTDISRPYPTPVICELIGAPRKDWGRFSDWTDEFAKIFAHNVVEDAPDILAAWEAMDIHIEGLVAARREAPADDVISELVRSEADDHISHSELLVMIMTFLAAGSDTTRNQLGASVDVLCDHPEQWEILADRPDLVPVAVEELLRYSPVFLHAPRVAIEDVTLGGVTIPAGTVVNANLAAANRDPAVFPDPDRLDILRDGSAPMMTFGGGTHNCLGAHLARLELVGALRVIARRMPKLRRSGPAPWKPFVGMTGPVTLPVEFEPGH